METRNFFVGREKVIELLNTFAEQAFTDAMPFLPFTEALRRYFKISGVDQLIILRLYINHEEMLTPAKLLHLHKRRKRISTV